MPTAGIEAIRIRVGELPNRAVIAAVMAVKEVALTEAVRIAGPDRSLRNAGRVKLGVRDDYRSGATTATVTASPPGIWSWFENGTPPHVIGFGRARGKKRNYNQAGKRGRALLRMPPSDRGVVTGPVFHPGTTGRMSWTKVRMRSEPIVRAIFDAEFASAVNG